MDVVSTTLTATAPRAATHWLAVIALTLGIFSIVTTEILPIGLLTSIGADFTISDGMAGLMMTMPGLVAAVAAPVITTATARADRRKMLCLFIFLLVLADVLMAAAPGYWLVLVSRVLVGITIGGFWSIAAGLAERLVPAESIGRANSVLFSAVPLGSVVGVPAGTFLGSVAGWRVTFLIVGVLTAALLVMLLLVVPALPANAVTRPRVLGAVLRSTATRFALLITFLLVLAHFGAYTYVTPFLEQVTGLGSGMVTVLLLSYGAAGMVGNFLGGAWVGRRPHAVLGAAAALIAVSTLLLPVLGQWELGALVLLVVWGVGYGAVPGATQAWFAAAAPAAPEAAAVLFTASFQATFSLGALTGGLIVDRSSAAMAMALGGLTALLVVPVTLTYYLRGNRPRAQVRGGFAA